MKRCKKCGCYLDPAEHCDCEEQDQTIDTPRRQVAPKKTIYPREWNSQEYIQQRWLEFDMR